MKAIQMWQPWASLVMIGAKRIETRAWAPRDTEVRQGKRIAVYATKHYDRRVARSPLVAGLLRAGGADPAALPTGAIIGTVRLQRVVPMTPELIEWIEDPERAREHALGVYEPGRYAWLLRAPVQIDPPIPWKGRQARFLDVPDPFAEPGARLEDTHPPAVQPAPPPPGTPPVPRFDQGSLL